MKIFLFLIYFIALAAFTDGLSLGKLNYMEYHNTINYAEQFVSDERYEEALIKYVEVFNTYDFVFLRDYKVAAQLAFYLDKKEMVVEIIQEGFQSGWKLKDLKKNKFLSALKKQPEWKELEESYDPMNEIYLSKIDPALELKAHNMFKKDQKKALGALFRIGDKSQIEYAEKKFAPHSEKQIITLLEIFNNEGYPGEKIIGNDFWISTIISHHNSISKNYSRKDTLYPHIRPTLKKFLEKGEISPYEFALIDDWYMATIDDHSAVGYGFIKNAKKSSLEETNQLRKKIGLRSVELRNTLIEVELKTGMNFYLPDWTEGEIEIE
ncbi:hypothetical protein [Lutimonas zeaxanthinifaciens]|uniref:hypothetical protein n=1 Tax=Lutimonas zeaxanthinifaciens TaxID=3060215 RepID=UPI00265D5775|nr:hypothetical protein [Lutimonas sp. YSD2104]WKK67151.1 hypothetical protein QZH61_05885 [Lutimonas sp. YSD2104]